MVSVLAEVEPFLEEVSRVLDEVVSASGGGHGFLGGGGAVFG